MPSQRKVIILAPGHTEIDRRVNRTVDAFKAIESEPKLFLERTSVTSAFNAGSHDATQLYEPIPTIALVRRQTARCPENLRREIASASLLYIHDSGLYGLLLARFCKRLTSAPLVFDYHDLVEWEIYFQLRKLLLPTTVIRRLIPTGMRVLRMLLGNNFRLEGLVGVSHSQLTRITERLALSVTHKLIVPNVRTHITPTRAPSTDGPLTVLWIGTVGRGRGLEKLSVLMRSLALRNHITAQACVIGHVRDREVLNKIIGMRYIGGFRSDEDIDRQVGAGRCVGIFWGWDDPCHTAINEIASVNKVYSYINLEIPFLLPRSLDNMRISCGIPDEMIYDREQEIPEKIEYLCQHFDRMSAQVRALKHALAWDHDIKGALQEFLRSIAHDARKPSVIESLV